MLIVDAHIHIWNKGLPRPAHRQSPYSADQVLVDMAKAQIDAAIIQPPAWDSDANQIAIAAAKLVVTDDLPTPPLPDAIA